MKPEELEIKKFELEQRVKLEELNLRKKEFDLKIQEQRSRRTTTPLILSIIGGVISVITGIVLNYFDKHSQLLLEDKKFQSSLLLKATDAENYDEFSNMIVTLQENGLLSLDSAKVANFRKNRFVAENTEKMIEADQETIIVPVEPNIEYDPPVTGPAEVEEPEPNMVWTIVAGGDANLDGAKHEKSRADRAGFNYAGVWYRQNSYRTCVGKYDSNTDALEDLWEVKETLNKTSYIVRLDQWCPDPEYDGERGIYICN